MGTQAEVSVWNGVVGQNPPEMTMLGAKLRNPSAGFGSAARLQRITPYMQVV